MTIILITGIAVLIGIGIYLVATSPINPTTPSSIFGEQIIRKLGEKESSFLIVTIAPGSVVGLWYQIYPIATGKGAPRVLRIGDNIGYTCEGISEKLTNIDFLHQKVTFIKVVGPRPFGGCPLCLSGNTLIDTPSGSIFVKDLKIGMLIWTINKTGQRLKGVVVKTSKVSVPPTHQMIHLVLNDGRQLFVSPGHPTISGQNIAGLKIGSKYDGAYIIGTRYVPYDQNYTYDVLPSGKTGFYWANGILLGSTLSDK